MTSALAVQKAAQARGWNAADVIQSFSVQKAKAGAHGVWDAWLRGELTWEQAWEHELRGYHGEWVSSAGDRVFSSGSTATGPLRDPRVGEDGIADAVQEARAADSDELRIVDPHGKHVARVRQSAIAPGDLPVYAAYDMDGNPIGHSTHDVGDAAGKALFQAATTPPHPYVAGHVRMFEGRKVAQRQGRRVVLEADLGHARQGAHTVNLKRPLLLAAVVAAVAAVLLGLVLAGVFAAARKGYVLPPVRASQASSSLSLVPVAAPGKILLAYNSGLQIGNDVLLYRATGDASYIQSAEKLAAEGAKTFGRFAYPTPPGNLIAFGFIYLRQLRLLEPYSQVARKLYAKQSSEFLAYVHAHVARGRGARSVRQLANGLWIDHESNEGVHIAWVWPAAMIGAAEEDRGLYRTAEALRYYWNGNSWSSATTGSHGVSGVFWDDNVWAALDTISLYQASHDPGQLQYVEKNLRFMESGWQHPYGGIRWVNRAYNNDVTAASTLGAEQEALWLYLLTHRAFDLKWAEGVQHWVAQRLTAPNGLIYDHLTPCGPHLDQLCFGRGKIVPRKPGQYDPLLYDAALIG